MRRTMRAALPSGRSTNSVIILFGAMLAALSLVLAGCAGTPTASKALPGGEGAPAGGAAASRAAAGAGSSGRGAPALLPPLYRPTITQESVLTPSTPLTAYRPFLAESERGPLIPGLAEQAVPQGLSYAPALDSFAVSAYFDGGAQSALFFVNARTGELTKTFWLAGPDGVALFGHVGGVAVSRRHLWVASEKNLYEYDIGAARSAGDGSVLAARRVIRTFSDASFAAYADGVLWVGEFAYYGPSAPAAYATPDSHHLTAPGGTLHHALVAGYRLDPTTDGIADPSHPAGSLLAGGYARPDLLISIPDRVQGMAVAGGRIFFSLSYGRTNESTIEEYSNPLEGPPAGSLSASVLGESPGRQDKGAVPLWFLSRENRVGLIVAPPMAEGIAPVAGRLAVLFESAALRYRFTGSYPLDRLYLLPATSLRPQ